MGFCRRCGDIVNSQRCNKCGGSVVAPAVSWNQTVPQEDQDKWSKIYVSRERPPPPIRPKSRGPPEATSGSPVGSISSPTKRFPRTIGAQITGSTLLDDRITDHIASAASQSGRPSPLKPTVTGPKPESGILPSLAPNDTTLSKVYGSVLQPKESLATHSCANCATPFLPDATIYPDPSPSTADEPHFLCRQCFIVGGGSKGLCPNCSKPVTILKAEGGFVYAADKYWHKKCFICEGCSKNIGDSPMVDLLGRPSCVECFDTCLSREPRTPKRIVEKPNSLPEWRNPGGFDGPSNSSNRFRESSPAIEELEQRLGIAKSREGSPAIEELGQRLSTIGKDYQLRYASPSSSPAQSRSNRLDGSPSPVRRLERFKSPDPEEQSDIGSPSVFGSPRRASDSPAPTAEAVEEMKKRFLRYSTTSPATSTVTLLESSPVTSASPLRTHHSTTSLRNSFSSRIPIPASRIEPMSPSSSTPDLLSDISDTLTQSSFSGADSPPRSTEPLFSQPGKFERRDLLSDPDDIIIEETKSQLNTPNQTPQSTIRFRSNTDSTPAKTPTKALFPSTDRIINSVSATTTCAKCNMLLFSLQKGGKFVTVPGDTADDTPQTFHKDCFRCTFCSGVFDEGGNGQAIFVKSNAGPAHVECAPPEKIVIRKSPSTNSLRFSHEKASLKNSHAPSKSPSPSPQRNDTNYRSSRFERPPTTAPATATSFPRFGSRSACPGCRKAVSPMERGVVPGPQGSRWHAECLVCGGKRPQSKSTSWMLGRGEEKKKEPGCGKKLDSAAKTDPGGRIWCRECLLMLGVGGSPQASPTRTPSIPTPVVSNSKTSSHSVGTTTIARQFTGLGGSDAGLLRQLTGGSISPTRSLSPTKQLGCVGSSGRPRPKSVIGMRSSKSIDEGRGMFLVRQLTGASSSGQWDGN
ncbi:hypothetical protein P691DRAFT_721366 [Macrolepiota fuliginosa MF-IS2]|uniref:LIM zinc-binding domain-containing protein n=1 Tax=Macrolepiota fuliginosa MF-IS2 TaxID=1400762 RepID=A0A9P5XKX2_9AGAR|nr:hypothetical protein P691DRAFT_721366 [Macrolepiota fuliginosa MF-IS2]